MPNEFLHGDHVCVLYEGEDEQLAVAAEYVAEGLRSGERCFYAADSSEGLGRFVEALDRTGVDAGGAMTSGALELATKAEAHLAGGRFDSERMLQMLNDAVERALNDGFAGLRTCGDMSWLLDDAPGSGEIVEYEALLNQFFESVRAVGMCQYDRTRLPAGLLDHALATHTSAVIDGGHKSNPFYQPAVIAMRRPAQPDTVAGKIEELRRR
jgi:hypothetical protein